MTLLWASREAPIPPVVIMNQPYGIPRAKVGLLDRIMPTTKAWAPLWRLRYALFGRKKIISVESTLINFTASDPLRVIDLLPGQPDFAGSDGLQVWRLKDFEVSSLLKRLKEATDDPILFSGRITVGDGTQAQMLCASPVPINGTQQQVGFSFDLLPRIRKGTTDLTAVVVFSKAVTNQITLGIDDPEIGSISIETNFAFAGQFQLPMKSAGILEIGLLLKSQVLQSKK